MFHYHLPLPKDSLYDFPIFLGASAIFLSTIVKTFDKNEQQKPLMFIMNRKAPKVICISTPKRYILWFRHINQETIDALIEKYF